MILGSCSAAGCLVGLLPSARAGRCELAVDVLPPGKAERAGRRWAGILKKGAKALEAAGNLDHPCMVGFEGAQGSGGGSLHAS